MTGHSTMSPSAHQRHVMHASHRTALAEVLHALRLRFCAYMHDEAVHQMRQPSKMHGPRSDQGPASSSAAWTSSSLCRPGSFLRIVHSHLAASEFALQNAAVLVPQRLCAPRL